MPEPEWDALAREVRDLAQRVAVLERHTGVRAVPAEAAPEIVPDYSIPEMPSLLPIVGRALLGLAGAYLLRALTESGTVPMRVGLPAGILYSLLWLGWAARCSTGDRLRPAIDSLTAVLVLSPLLFEATARFHAIDVWTSALVLLAFALFGMAISWRKSLLIVSTFATLAALGTATALLMTTHNVLPFTFLFLAIAAAIEISACLDHWMSERWLGAAAADLSVLLATWLVTNDRGLPETYAPVPYGWLVTAQIALLTIYLSSTIVRTLVRHVSFTGFETAQCVLVFAVALSGGWKIAPVMAAVMLICAAACYLVSFVLLERRGGPNRNFYTYSTFGILLALTGSGILLLPANAASLGYVLAITCVLAGGRLGRMTLRVHGGIYLVLGLVLSGAVQASGAFLLGTALWPGGQQPTLWIGLAAAATVYFLLVRYPPEAKDSRPGQAFSIIVAMGFLWLAAGIAAGGLTGLYHLTFGADASHAYCATLRTGVLAGLSLVLAWAAPRGGRTELSRLVYPVMFLGGYRLIAQDLHEGHKLALFLSLLMYGAVLIALPRLKKSALAGSP